MAHYFSDIIYWGDTKDSVHRSITAGNKMELLDTDGSRTTWMYISDMFLYVKALGSVSRTRHWLNRRASALFSLGLALPNTVPNIRLEQTPFCVTNKSEDPWMNTQNLRGWECKEGADRISPTEMHRVIEMLLKMDEQLTVTAEHGGLWWFRSSDSLTLEPQLAGVIPTMSG